MGKRTKAADTEAVVEKDAILADALGLTEEEVVATTETEQTETEADAPEVEEQDEQTEEVVAEPVAPAETDEPVAEEVVAEAEQAPEEVSPVADESAEEVPAEPTEEPVAQREAIVTDGNGRPMFKRMEPNRVEADNTRKPRTPASYKERTKQVAYGITSNAAQLAFPTDRWGITKDLKKAFIQTASRVAGDESKRELVEEVLSILTEYLGVKFEADKAYKLRLAERRED